MKKNTEAAKYRARSEMLSSVAPNLVHQLKRRAMSPSSISEIAAVTTAAESRYSHGLARSSSLRKLLAH